MTLTLDRAVQMDDGYLLYATLHWEDTPFSSVDVIDPAADAAPAGCERAGNDL